METEEEYEEEEEEEDDDDDEDEDALEEALLKDMKITEDNCQRKRKQRDKTSTGNGLQKTIGVLNSESRELVLFDFLMRKLSKNMRSENMLKAAVLLSRAVIRKSITDTQAKMLISLMKLIFDSKETVVAEQQLERLKKGIHH